MQQAMHNALCDVLWQKKNQKKNPFKKKKITQKNAPIKFASYHTHRITLVVSHSHATSGGI